MWEEYMALKILIINTNTVNCPWNKRKKNQVTGALRKINGNESSGFPGKNRAVLCSVLIGRTT
jgi:hypothetical protein